MAVPPTNHKKRRSAQWFSRQDIYGFIYRSWVRNRGVPNDQFDGRAVIGIDGLGSHPVLVVAYP